MIDPFKEGSRKLTLVYFLSILGSAAYAFSTRSVAELTALFGFYIGLAGWYNQSNVREHQIKEGNGK